MILPYIIKLLPTHQSIPPPPCHVFYPSLIDFVEECAFLVQWSEEETAVAVLLPGAAVSWLGGQLVRRSEKLPHTQVGDSMLIWNILCKWLQKLAGDAKLCFVSLTDQMQKDKRLRYLPGRYGSGLEPNEKKKRFFQCWGSGSVGSLCFWASRIRIRIRYSQLRILTLSSKNSKNKLDFYCFVTSTFYLWRKM